MIDETVQLPCGAKLAVMQGDDPDTYLLLRLVGDRSLDKFVRVEPEKNAITISVDPKNIPALAELVSKIHKPSKRFKFNYSEFAIGCLFGTVMMLWVLWPAVAMLLKHGK